MILFLECSSPDQVVWHLVLRKSLRSLKRDQFKVICHLPTINFSGDMLVFRGGNIFESLEHVVVIFWCVCCFPGQKRIQYVYQSFC